MKKSNQIYLAYGSNMNIEQMAYRCPYAVPLGTSTLEGYKLLFRGGKDCSVATIEPDADSSVPVLLWEITPRCEEALDRYEGWPRLYRKEVLSVQFKGKPIDAMVYIMNDGRELGYPSGQYLKIIYDSYLDAEIDTDILNDALITSCKYNLTDYGLV